MFTSGEFNSFGGLIAIVGILSSPNSKSHRPLRPVELVAPIAGSLIAVALIVAKVHYGVVFTEDKLKPITRVARHPAFLLTVWVIIVFLMYRSWKRMDQERQIQTA